MRDFPFVGRVAGALPERRNFLIKFESLVDLWKFATVYHQLSVEDVTLGGGGSGTSSGVDESYESIPETQNQWENNRLQPFDKK